MRFERVTPSYPAVPSSAGKIAFVGEAPSDYEMLAGRPFVGPSGRVFDTMLRRANIDRFAHLVTNVFDVQADDNDVNPWMKDKSIYEPAFERLASEIAAVSPDVIVPLGSTALWAFTEYTNITPFRGAVSKATRIAPGAKLLPTFHPAMVIRQWKVLPMTVGDLMKAAREAAKGPKIRYPDAKIWLEPTISDVRNWVPIFKSADLLSVDIETGWGQITEIGFAPEPTVGYHIPFVDLRKRDRNYWKTPEEEFAVWRMVQDVLEHPNRKLGQNFGYDFAWLYERGIHVRNCCDDTRLLHHAMFPELPKDLATMGGNYTDIGAWKAWGGRYNKEKRDA